MIGFGAAVNPGDNCGSSTTNLRLPPTRGRTLTPTIISVYNGYRTSWGWSCHFPGYQSEYLRSTDTEERRKKILRCYRRQLDLLREDQMSWTPSLCGLRRSI